MSKNNSLKKMDEEKPKVDKNLIKLEEMLNRQITRFKMPDYRANESKV